MKCLILQLLRRILTHFHCVHFFPRTEFNALPCLKEKLSPISNRELNAEVAIQKVQVEEKEKKNWVGDSVVNDAEMKRKWVNFRYLCHSKN